MGQDSLLDICTAFWSLGNLRSLWTWHYSLLLMIKDRDNLCCSCFSDEEDQLGGPESWNAYQKRGGRRVGQLGDCRRFGEILSNSSLYWLFLMRQWAITLVGLVYIQNTSKKKGLSVRRTGLAECRGAPSQPYIPATQTAEATHLISETSVSERGLWLSGAFCKKLPTPCSFLKGCCTVQCLP